MTNPEFDKYAAAYDEALDAAIPEGMNEDRYFAEYKVMLMAEQLRDNALVRILDFGCGAGRSLPYLDKHFPQAELWGYDPSSVSLLIAAQRTPRARLLSDWAELAGTTFDAVIAANVFHHIPPAQRVAELQRCRAALSPQGQMFVFEHNPYNPMTRWVFDRCIYDADAEMLSLRRALTLCKDAGFTGARHGYTLFFPQPLSALRRLEPLLARVPLGAQYYVRLER